MERRVSRRTLLRWGAELGFAAGFGVVAGVLCKNAEQKSKHLWGEPIKGEKGKLMATGEDSEIPVRRFPTLEDNTFLGYAKSGQVKSARAYYGVVYPNDGGSGEIIGPDGEKYGRWDKLRGLRVMVEENGQQVEKYFQDVFVADTRLREASTAERHEFFTSSE